METLRCSFGVSIESLNYKSMRLYKDIHKNHMFTTALF